MSFFDKITIILMKLPIELRGELASRLLQSLHDEDDSIPELTEEELQKRIDDIESGRETTITHEEFTKSIQEYMDALKNSDSEVMI